MALANALDHTSLPLYGILDLLGKSRVLTTARNLPRTLTAVVAALTGLAALVLIPADLRLEGKGTLEPVHRRDVFSGIDGVIESIADGVAHGLDVKEAHAHPRRERHPDSLIAQPDGRRCWCAA